MSRRILVVFLLLTLKLSAQQTAIYVDPERRYQTGLDLLLKQKYAAAQKEFRYILSSRDNISYQTKANASYFIGKCAAELFNKDAENLLLAFMENYPAGIYYQSAVYDLANFYYRGKRYKNAIEWFEKIDQTPLTQDKKDEVNFKAGYSYYQLNDYDKASKAFYKMKDGNTKYASAAQYYYGHIAYVNENYETALESFKKLKDSSAFSTVVPYYITQIYYKQRKYNEVLEYAPGVVDTTNSKNGLEISRIVAESYYRKEDYAKAIPYLVDYEKNSSAAGRADQYQLAFSYYKTKQYDKAIPYFQKVIVESDSLSQNANFHLADCYIRTNNKRSARTAFQNATKTNFDSDIREESLFNYGKLSYELNFQSEALKAFRQLSTDYPNSAFIDQSNEMLVGIYSNTRNYKDALTALEAIKNKTANIRSAYQRVALYRGLELFMDNNNSESVKLFNTSLSYPVDQNLVAEATYWKAEALYRSGDYKSALKGYNEYMLTPAAVKSPRYNLVNYNIGYCQFKLEDYSIAQSSFRKYIREKSDTDPARYNDALLRIADCYFVMGDKTNALDYYGQAISGSGKATDYALYQKSIILGVQGKNAEKVTTLQKLFEKYPKSVYFDDGLYEAGQASMINSQYEEALTFYRKLLNDYPSSAYYRKAELGEALVYYNTKQDDKALTAYKNIVKKYPNTSESHEALSQIKNISVSQNKVDEYVNFVKDVPNADVSAASQDSLVYEAAELRYTQGNCPEAISDFTKYIDRYPNAIFKVNASYYRADCLFRNKKQEEALADYEYVISQPKTPFTEKSLLNAALINYRKKDYQKALSYYTALESNAEVKDNVNAAIIGQMRCNYRLQNWDNALSSSQKLLSGTITDKDLINEAHLVAGKSFFAKEQYADAKTELQVVAKRTNSEMTAESKYLLAFIEYRQKNFKESQKLIFEIQKQVPSYDYWIAKGFILLGDNYLAQKDTFQAKETYKSILDNYQSEPSDPDDLRMMAKEKLDAITVEKTGEADKKEKQDVPSGEAEINITK